VGLNVGENRNLVTVENPGPQVPDGEGGYTQSYVKDKPWRAAIQKATVRLSESRFSSTVLAHATHILIGRYHKGISTHSRLTWTDFGKRVHVANVLDVNDLDGAGVESDVLVSEIAP